MKELAKMTLSYFFLYKQTCQMFIAKQYICRYNVHVGLILNGVNYIDV